MYLHTHVCSGTAEDCPNARGGKRDDCCMYMIRDNRCAILSGLGLQSSNEYKNAPATLSPTVSPAARIAPDICPTRARNSLQLQFSTTCIPFEASPGRAAVMAILSSFRESRFSAKLSRAPGNQVGISGSVPGSIIWADWLTRSYRWRLS